VPYNDFYGTLLLTVYPTKPWHHWLACSRLSLMSGNSPKKALTIFKNFSRFQGFKKILLFLRNHRPPFLKLFLPQHPFLVTHKQSSTPYHWLTPGYYKDKLKTNVFLLPPHMWHSQNPLKLISAPQVKKPCHRPSSMLLTSAFSVHDDQYVFVAFGVYFREPFRLHQVLIQVPKIRQQATDCWPL